MSEDLAGDVKRLTNFTPEYRLRVGDYELYLKSKETVLKLHAEILEKNGEKQFAVLPYEEFLELQERLADAEDVLELRKAKLAEAKKKSIPLADVKRKLGLR